MKYGVRLKIDVSKIDKARLFSGAKGTYLDATVFIDVDNQDQYGNNGMITQDITKEEKEQGQQGAILGNASVFWNEGGQQQTQQQGYQNQQNPTTQSQKLPPNQQGWGGQQQAPQQTINTANAQFVQQQPNQQQAPKVNPQEPSIDFDDDIPF